MKTKKIEDLRPDLPHQPQIGDRIRIKEEFSQQLRNDCKAAGWDVDPNEVRVVIRCDEFGPGGSRRLFVDGPPFAFNPAHVDYAWEKQGDERRAMLQAAGWRV
jgi:hypothetical protein